MSARRPLGWIGIAIAVVAVAGVAVLAWYATRPGPLDFVDGKRVAIESYSGARPSGIPADVHALDTMARGRYLTQAADCEACHTIPGGTPFAGGRPFKTPFGTLYAPNITPDPETGIGSYSDADFLRAVHKGIRRDGARLYPAFPYASYTYLTDEDVLAIKAYLFTLAPVKSPPEQNELAFPFNQRWLMTFWSALFNPDERFRPVEDRTPEWNRGAYLVEALGHCGDCHTPRNLFQGLDNSRKFAGTTVEGWHAYNITMDAGTGVGAWSDAELAQYLSSGHAHGRGTAAGPMGEAVDLSLRHLSPTDISAMVAYLRSVPAVASAGVPTKLAGPAPASHSAGVPPDFDVRGKQIFEGACASCHEWNGTGALTPYATLTGSRTVNDPSAINVAQVIIAGARRDSPEGNAYMPAFGDAYSDGEIAAVANYVTRRFGAEGSSLSAAQVAKLRQSD